MIFQPVDLYSGIEVILSKSYRHSKTFAVLLKKVKPQSQLSAKKQNRYNKIFACNSICLKVQKINCDICRCIKNLEDTDVK